MWLWHGTLVVVVVVVLVCSTEASAVENIVGVKPKSCFNGVTVYNLLVVLVYVTVMWQTSCTSLFNWGFRSGEHSLRVQSKSCFNGVTVCDLLVVLVCVTVMWHSLLLVCLTGAFPRWSTADFKASSLAVNRDLSEVPSFKSWWVGQNI